MFPRSSADWRCGVERCQVFPAGSSVVVTRQTFPHRDLWTHERPVLAAPKRPKPWGQRPHWCPISLVPTHFNPVLLTFSSSTLLSCCLNLSSCFSSLCCTSAFVLLFNLMLVFLFSIYVKMSQGEAVKNISLLCFLKGKSCWCFIDFWGGKKA